MSLTSGWCAIVCVSLAAYPAGGRAQTEQPYFLLPASQAKKVVQQCSRRAPEAESGWTPSAADLAQAEANIATIVGLKTRRGTMADPQLSLREYVGIVVSGKHLIYLNAFPLFDRADYLKDRKLKRTSIICDGGPAFWGAVYDPATGRFSDVQMNGSA